MKKTIFSLALLATIGFTCQAQTFIPKAGVSFSNVAFQNTQAGQKATTGFLVGAGFNFPMDTDGFFSIQPELLYIQKGYQSQWSTSSKTTDANIHLNYLEIPILAKLSFGSESLKGYINAGPSIGFGMGGKANKTTFDGTKTTSVTGSVKFGPQPLMANSNDVYVDNQTDFGLQFGGGIGYQVGPGSLLLDVRYGLGMTNLYNLGDKQSAGANKSQNRVLALSLGYAIPLGGK